MSAAKAIVKSKEKAPVTLESLFKTEAKVAVRWAKSGTDHQSGTWAVINPKKPQDVSVEITTPTSYLTNVLLGAVEVSEVTYSCGSSTSRTKKVGLCVGNLNMSCPSTKGLQEVNLTFDGEQFFYYEGTERKELKKAAIVALHPKRYAVAYLKVKKMKKVN